MLLFFQLWQERQNPDFPPKSAYTCQPESYLCLPTGTTEPTENTDGFHVPYETSHCNNHANQLPQQNSAIKNYQIAHHLEKRLCTTPLDKLTGIQMIASVAETFGQNSHPETEVWTEDLHTLKVETALNPGDVIGKLKLPFIENSEGNSSVGLLCECSIVFERFVGMVDIKEYSVDAKKQSDNSEMSLQDIIDGEEEDENFGEDSIDPDLEFLKQKHHEQVQSKGGKTGRKMDVYKYKEPEVASEIQNELQKTIVTVPELLKDPAVVKYLETMTGKAFESVSEEDQVLNVTDVKTERETDRNTDKGVNESYMSVSEDNSGITFEGHKPAQIDAMEEQSNEIISEVSNERHAKINSRIDRKFVQKELKKSTVVVKWTQNSGGIEKSESENYKQQQAMDVSFSGETEDKPQREAHTDCQDGCENDDAEQEMMDIESDIEEDKCDENKMDTLSEKKLSLLNSKVEKLVKDEINKIKILDKFDAGKVNNDERDNTKKEAAKILHASQKKKVQSEKNYFLGEDMNVNEEKVQVSEDSENNFSNKTLKFSCSVCQKTVNSIQKLRKHFLTHENHSKEPRKSLRVINKRLNILSKKVSESLNKPLEKSTDSTLFYCMLCDEMFSSKQELSDHCKTHNSDDYSDVCVKPDGTATSDDTLTADSDVDYESGNETEDIDNYAPKNSKFQINRHSWKLPGKIKRQKMSSEFEAVTGEKKTFKEKVTEMNRRKTISKDYICEKCGEGFLKIKECTSHSEQCSETGKLKCFQGCGYKFKTKSELDVHKRFCSRRIAYLERLNKELVKKELQEQSESNSFENNEIDEGGNSPVNCPFCNQKYQTDEKMLHHKLVCPHRPKQKCNHCSFECKGDKSMAKHLVEKHNLKPFKCEQCARSFKLKGSLRDHVKYAHTRETFTCEYCGKSFIKQRMYRSHVSIQHEGFRFVCNYCGKQFKDKRTWVIHEKSHKGAYDYACTMCKKTFNRSEQYKAHMQDVHSIEGKAALSLNNAAKEVRDKLCSNVCHICKETFPLEAAYTLHLIKVHGQS